MSRVRAYDPRYGPDAGQAFYGPQAGVSGTSGIGQLSVIVQQHGFDAAVSRYGIDHLIYLDQVGSIITVGRIACETLAALGGHQSIGPIAQCLQCGLLGYVGHRDRRIIQQAMLSSMLALKYDVAVRRKIDFVDRIVPIHGEILMRLLDGPRYKYQGERLTTPEIIVIQDHHYDDGGYALQQLLDNSQCPADQHVLVFDHVLRQDEFARYHCVCLPLLLAAECKEFNQQRIKIDWTNRRHAFNFMINKPRPHRLLLLDMVHSLGLSDYRHSLCWSHDHKSIPRTDYKFGDERTLEQGILNGSHANACTYDSLLKRTVFEPTCVSLITEPAFHERETIITEKTLMAIWAGTLPIWVGGWRCAETMRDMGFDVFEDVIDHGYQALLDPVERCRQAVLLNIHLLERPIDLVPLISRLRHNLELLRQNVFLRQVDHLLSSYHQLGCLRDQFRNGSLV